MFSSLFRGSINRRLDAEGVVIIGVWERTVVSNVELNVSPSYYGHDSRLFINDINTAVEVFLTSKAETVLVQRAIWSGPTTTFLLLLFPALSTSYMTPVAGLTEQPLQLPWSEFHERAAQVPMTSGFTL